MTAIVRPSGFFAECLECRVYEKFYKQEPAEVWKERHNAREHAGVSAAPSMPGDAP